MHKSINRDQHCGPYNAGQVTISHTLALTPVGTLTFKTVEIKENRRRKDETERIKNDLNIA
jgi:hypothetical protein